MVKRKKQQATISVGATLVVALKYWIFSRVAPMKKQWLKVKEKFRNTHVVENFDGYSKEGKTKMFTKNLQLKEKKKQKGNFEKYKKRYG